MGETVQEPLIFPLAHYVGQRFDPETETSTFDVRAGWRVVHLSQREREVWALVHGLANRIREGTPWTRTAILHAAGPTLGAEAAASAIESLLAKGVVAEVTPRGEAAVDFARRVRLMPLQLGLGNTREKAWIWRVGSPTGGVELSEVVYQIWEWGYLHRDLWTACEDLARRNSADYESPEGVEDCDPEAILAEVLSHSHKLLSATCAYFDAASDEKDQTDQAGSERPETTAEGLSGGEG